MRFVWIGALVCGSTLLAQTPPTVPVINVNARYQVESVEISGEGEFDIPSGILDEMNSLVGTHLDMAALDGLATRIRKELHAKSVSHRITRGDLPEHVKVYFEVKRRSAEFNVSVPRFLYHSKQGWTGQLESQITYSTSTVTFGMLSDSDELAERNAGILARYENRRIGSDRVRLRMQFESYHQQWNRSTLAALDGDSRVPGIYRIRQNLEPSVTFVLAPPLTLTTGVSFEFLQTQFPAARFESSNSVVNTLRYHRQWEDLNANKHVMDAGYSLRAATKVLSSDFAYARHRWDLAYAYTHGNQGLAVNFFGGVIGGRAPLFERYVLGNSSTLRGWNKFDVAPLGGNRVVHNSLKYRYRAAHLFYDAGAVWNRGEDPDVRHGLGAGFLVEGFSIAVAFPVKKGRAEPVFMAGMNF